uniref:Protein arginine N-methyltransferase n=1 Tax=Syphacia muris TaxID=451379 RepID=A0A158R551_9BILA
MYCDYETSQVTAMVGWVGTDIDGNNDRRIPVYSSMIGASGYHFINYPIGGIERANWRFGRSTKPPPIDLPDLQLTSHLWSTYVIGRISPWIDCDSSDPSIAELSIIEIEKELSYMCYMPMRVVTIELKHRDSPNLAKVITKWLWTKPMNFSIWVFVPTDENCLAVSENTDSRDIWSIWADFRTLCTNYPMDKFAVGLRICADLADEFLEPRLYKRWNAEQLRCFWIDTDIFTTDLQFNSLSIPPAHLRLLSDLFVSMSQRPMICPVGDKSTSDNLRRQYVDAIKRLYNEKVAYAKKHRNEEKEFVLFEFLGHPEYINTLQVPLQPLADNLDSSTYSTFEEDRVKYEMYRGAILKAIPDVINVANGSREAVIMLLGAGRGPLMQIIIECEAKYNESLECSKRVRFKLIAVEKNANAIVTLRFLNQIRWYNRVTLVESDMRDLPSKVKSGQLPQPDLIVSELLGSFGDNELSPECLDGVTDMLLPTTISIPSSYTSYVAPIQSVRMHQKVRCCSDSSVFNKGLPKHGRLMPQLQEDGSYVIPQHSGISPFDEVYVVNLRSICLLADPQPVFTFNHPNFEKHSNEKSSIIRFHIDMQSELMGFAGYFEADLYGGVKLSIVPKTHSKSMNSWFPALIPLRELIRLQSRAQVIFHIERKSDGDGVWYEWFVEYKENDDAELKRTTVQNKDGLSYYMHL